MCSIRKGYTVGDFNKELYCSDRPTLDAAYSLRWDGTKKYKQYRSTIDVGWQDKILSKRGEIPEIRPPKQENNVADD